MSLADDAVGAACEVVDVDLPNTSGPRSLRPRGEAVAGVGLAPRARPEAAGRSRLCRPDLPELPALGIPRPGREVVEARERVILVPDEPASVERAVRLVCARVRKSLDRRIATARGVDPDDTRVPVRVERREERPPVSGEPPGDDRGAPREGDDACRKGLLPGGARRRIATAAPEGSRVPTGPRNGCPSGPPKPGRRCSPVRRRPVRTRRPPTRG